MLNLTVERAFRLHHLQTENSPSAGDADARHAGKRTTRDPQMLRICRTIEKVANTNASVMLLGESGTGKEVWRAACTSFLIAKDGKFVAIASARRP